MRVSALASLSLLLVALAGCDTPPKSAYVALQDSHAGAVPAGKNTAGEACRRLDLGGGAADIYCGEWERPSARIRQGGAAAGASLASLAAGDGEAAPWRHEIDSRFACAEPRPTTILGGSSAELLDCRYRNGGFPQLALVADVGGKIWFADTIDAAFQVTQNSIGQLAGVRAEASAPSDEPLDPKLASRLAARSFAAGDIQAYQTLMREAADANRQGDTVGAEKLYRNVLALQEKVLGKDSPDLANATMSLGLQLSNQGRFGEADAAFKRAEQLIGPSNGDPTTPPKGSNPTSRARLLQYRALDADNRGVPSEALPLLDQSEKAYRVYAQEALDSSPSSGEMVVETMQNSSIEALFGVIDVKRNRAWTYRLLGKLPESEAEARAAADLAAAKLPPTRSHWRERETAYVSRTRGLTLAQQGQTDRAIISLDNADRDFTRVYRATRPQAETKLRLAAQLINDHRPDEALENCHQALDILARRKDGVDAELMAPCLEAYALTAGGVNGQDRLAEMFEAAQQVRSTLTNQQIQQAARRMSENTRDPRAAELIRKREEADKKLDALERQRLLATQGANGGSGPTLDAAAMAKLDQDIDAAAKQSAALEDELQAASPSYNQLVPKVVSAKDLMAALHPGEAFVDIVLSEKAGWTFLLRDGKISIGRVEGGSARAADLVQRIRHTLEPDDAGRVPGFDVAASQELFKMVLGPVADGFKGASTLTISPAGPLLSLPFEVLLTGPASRKDYAGAPWLVKQYAIAHVPEPGNFLALRKLAGTSRAPQPWFGFGDAANVSLAQAQASFPSARCGDAAQELAGLPVLSDALDELNASRAVFHAAASDQMTGPAFTAEAVTKLPLKQYRVLHFAAHGLLPTDLACQSQPAIVTSAPRGAADANGALLSSSQIEKLDLDAELIILSACNSGGPGGKTAGESLSGMARSFFAANARALMVSHWSLSSQAATTLVPATLQLMRDKPELGVAGALRDAQLAWLNAFQGAPTHPHFWAALAIFGDGGGGPKAAAKSMTDVGAVSHPG
jgi:CHAT domain-containing protein